MTIAVTGSSGFIGQHLIKRLKEDQFDVIEISRFNGLDISNWEAVKNIPSFDVIVHLAAKSFVPDSFDHPREFYYVNQISTLNTLELARKYMAKVIFLSSYLYGTPQNLPVSEDHPINPHNPYAQTKLICEKICEGYNRDFKVPVTIFRPFNIYGPGQKEPFLIPTILKQAKSGKIELKDPRPKRDYIHVLDIVNAIVKSIATVHKNFNVLNLGSGISYSVQDLVAIVQKEYNEQLKVKFKNEYRNGEVLDTVADISRCQNMIAWMPKIDLASGIKALIKAARN